MPSDPSLRGFGAKQQRSSLCRKGDVEMMKTGKDLELVARCVRKEREAWQEFVAMYYRVIHRQIRHLLQTRGTAIQKEDVEDLSHSVLLAFLKDDGRRLRCFEGKCSLKTWVRVITTNEVIDQLRKNRPQVSLDGAGPGGLCLKDTLQAPGPSAEEHLVEAQRRRLLDQALNEVSPEDRKLAVLAYEMEMSTKEIASALRISTEAVYTRKHRLQQKLRRAMR
jgi:RNA polymerase sigma-70 factor (ECF subfamily)